MTTVTKSYSEQNATYQVYSNAEAAKSSTGLISRYNKLVESLKFSHFGLITMAILVGSCLGSIAAMFVFQAGAPIWVFGIGLFASMANLVACISQAPTKWVLNMFAFSVVVNILLLAFFIPAVA